VPNSDGHTCTTPRLNFACEVDAHHLTLLFAGTAVIEHLQMLGARVALTLADLSEARAAVVQRLNHENLPVVGIPLLSLEDGSYFTPDNTRRAEEHYQDVKDRTTRRGLVWEVSAWTSNPTLGSICKSCAARGASRR
jgi:hypothetical protein